MNYFGFLLILVTAITICGGNNGEITWKLYEVTPSESEQVELLRTMIATYPLELFVNGEVREDETAYFLMKTSRESDIIQNIRDNGIEHSPSLHHEVRKRLPSKKQENIFGVLRDKSDELE